MRIQNYKLLYRSLKIISNNDQNGNQLSSNSSQDSDKICEIIEKLKDVKLDNKSSQNQSEVKTAVKEPIIEHEEVKVDKEKTEIKAEVLNHNKKQEELRNVKKPDEPKHEKISEETKHEKLSEEPKQEMRQKELITPAFNQGVRTAPPNNYQESPSSISVVKRGNEEKTEVIEKPENTDEKKFFSMEPMRRNLQSPLTMAKKPKEMRYTIRDLKVRPLKMGKVKVKLAHGEEKTKIFSVMEAGELIDSFMTYVASNINDFVSTDTSKSFKPLEQGEMVLAKYDDVYYRAVIEDINDKDPNNVIYDVYFIDYGNSSQVTEEEMKPFSSKLKNEIVVNSVYLQNYPAKITEEQADMMSSEEGFYINIIDQSDGCYIADIVGI